MILLLRVVCIASKTPNGFFQWAGLGQPQKLSFLWGSCPPSNTWFSAPT